MSAYRIMLADDQEIFRNGIRNTLCQQKEFHICGEACNPQEFMQRIDKAHPDLVILEIDLPQSNGIKILNAVRQEHKQIKVLILTHSKKREFIYLALHNGADGFLLKEEPSGELLRAVNVIRNGGKFYSALLSADLMSLISTKKPGKPILTSREEEILRHLGEGERNKQIAEHLNISICTVNRHCYNIKKKLNLKHRSELVKYSIEHKGSLEFPR